MSTQDSEEHLSRDYHQLLRERELAARWRMSTRTLQRWRGDGSGPVHLVIGGSIRYRLSDVIAFERGGSGEISDA